MEAPFGSWRSPITAEIVGGRSMSLQEVAFDGDDLVWTEIRPEEKGRAAIVRRRAGGGIEDLLPAPFDARTRVYEYGGGSFLALGGRIVFSSYADGRLYELRPGAAPRPLTPEGGRKHSDPTPIAGGRAAIAIVEDGKRHFLGRIDLERGGAAAPVVEGRDFYFSPRASADGKRLAWIEWSDPDMPWDGSELFVGEIGPDGSIHDRKKVAGSRGESICEPRWSPDGRLVFASDRSGWWNLWILGDRGPEPLVEREAEFTQAPWTSDASSWAFSGPGSIVCARREGGYWALARLDVASRRLEDIALPFDQITDVRATPRAAAFFAGSARHSWSLVRLDLATGRHDIVRANSDLSRFESILSEPRRIDFPTGGGKTAHAFFYPPANPGFTSAGKPPLIVIGHGGPTAHTFTTVRLEVQFFTSRGFAVLDVDYGGSAGWGREYRERLTGAWGVVDVEDCVNAARHVADRGLVDGSRMAIRGGSAGGYTVLCALAFHPGSFQAGASHYGVSDLEALARDTHKFEARYLDKLVGPWPEARAVYEARSPLRHTERLVAPVIFFQGLDDKVVPPSQTESMVAALRARKVPVAYLPFEGEQHGFRKAENKRRALEAELWFYGKLFGFTPADPIEPVEIANLG